MRICGHSKRGFTLVEITICIAIVTFSLVVIVGLLPRGLQTQRDSRATTIVGQDALYWLDAIRSGSRGLDDLTNYIECIEIGSGTAMPTILTFGRGFTNADGIIGSLCTEGSKNRAIVRAISGAAVDRATSNKDLAFRYVLDIYRATDDSVPPHLRTGPARLSNLQLSLRWPVLAASCPVPPNRIGRHDRTLRTLVADLGKGRKDELE